MCRNIRVLFNFEPPATEEEIHAAALQFVRKISGTHKPSHENSPAFEQAVEEVKKTSRRLLKTLKTNAKPKNREEEKRKARERAAQRFGT